jgi:mevalonate kinase
MNMSIAEKKVFYAKILLFGEYSIISGGQALTFPLKKFSGSLDFFTSASNNLLIAKASNVSLKNYLDYLLDIQSSSQFLYPLDLDRLDQDLSAGLFFNSNIPQGYGAGSSGAMVAALFYQYALQGSNRDSRLAMIPSEVLLQQLAKMESYFHGSSSGLDPLSSLTGKPFVANNQRKITYQKSQIISSDPNTSIFLINTGTVGKTKPLVDWYKKEVSHQRLNANLLKDLSDETLSAFLDKDSWLFWNYLTQLSLFQLENMKPMIPRMIHGIWEKGLHDQSFILKLCGSGGGGFVLGFTKDYSSTREYFNSLQFSLIEL